MTPIIKIVNDELDYINAHEERSNKIRFDPSFIKEKSGLYMLMCVLFIITVLVLIYSSSFTVYDLALCIALFILLNGFFIFNIKPPYQLSDIDRILIKICYTGEWYREVPVREECIDKILSSDDIPAHKKNELARLASHKKYVYFEDLLNIDKMRE